MSEPTSTEKDKKKDGMTPAQRAEYYVKNPDKLKEHVSARDAREKEAADKAKANRPNPPQPVPPQPIPTK